MAGVSQTFKAVQIFGITSSTFLSGPSHPLELLVRIVSLTNRHITGFAFSASYLGLPALALAPVALRLRQWLVIYDLGKLVSPTVAAASSVAWGYITYISYATRELPGTSISGTPRWVLYGVAGLATFGILPWTVAVMMPTNNELIRRAKLEKKEAVEKEDVEMEKLLKTWNQMNYLRAALPMVGVVVGLWTALA